MSSSSPISALGYFVFGVSDLSKWEDFAANILGAATRPAVGGGLALRIDDYEQRFLLNEDGTDDLQAIGWEFDTEAALDGYVEQLKAAGTTVVVADDATLESRRVEKLYCCEDPNGWQHEFYFGPNVVTLTQRFSSPLVAGGFVAGRLGAGHLVAVAKSAEQTNSFYQQVLQLTVSDYIKGEVFPGGPVLDATFYHVATGRHHSIAVAEAPTPKRIDHMMVQVNDLDDVGMALDRSMAANLPVRAGMGHHPNDRMTSFYVQTPSGFFCEYGWGGIVIDDDNWEVVRYSQLSDWGHQPLSAPAI
ncbi:MAG: glyoxalase [Gammaproteobacteria bacterium]|nr:MAG: glyoxalase [Gammaproteobacteria bacterium]RLA10875.1 MAG: glyoxalase [Gammaproteobacteria bacterium]RLA16122.1 MAG: glyoxalase [Gammaproteobacteria bacterium]